MLALLVGLLIARWMRGRATQFQCMESLTVLDTDTLFFVVGNWGHRGSAEQRRAAELMANVATHCMKPQFIISTGDNFNPHGLQSSQDSQVAASFTDVYSHKALQVDWYAVLGDRDYGAGLPASLLEGCPRSQPPSQLASCQGACCYSPLWQVSGHNLSGARGPGALPPQWHLQQGATQHQFGDLQVTFVDTSPVLSKCRSEPWAALPGGVASQDAQQQRAHVEALLSRPSPLKLVVGHHPVRSFGSSCYPPSSNCDELSAWLSPLLQQHKVLSYLSGHERDLQFIKRTDDPVAYVLSGGGAEVAHDSGALPLDARVYIHDDQGFVAVHARDGVVTVHIWTASWRGPGPAHKIRLS